VSCIEDGFTSVMIDGSALPGAGEETVHRGPARCTDPAQVSDFVMRTGVDSLAVSIGTSHGVVKGTAEPSTGLPALRFDMGKA